MCNLRVYESLSFLYHSPSHLRTLTIIAIMHVWKQKSLSGKVASYCFVCRGTHETLFASIPYHDAIPWHSRHETNKPWFSHANRTTHIGHCSIRYWGDGSRGDLSFVFLGCSHQDVRHVYCSICVICVPRHECHWIPIPHTIANIQLGLAHSHKCPTSLTKCERPLEHSKNIQRTTVLLASFHRSLPNWLASCRRRCVFPAIATVSGGGAYFLLCGCGRCKM